MVFSSPEFLFLFLPIVLALYFIMGTSVKNVFLLFASLFFYAWGEGHLVFLMVTSIGINYLGGKGIGWARDKQIWLAKLILGLTIVANLGFLGYYKYYNFFLDNITALGWLGDTDHVTIILPIGISFFTFQSISYVIDVYRREAEVQQNPLNLGLYISLFPQLIAGPIVRYHDVAQQIESRSHTWGKFSEGIIRFVRGLAKKIVIANPMALVADQVFNSPADELSMQAAWIGILAYTFQIYFDFSGYSDMAIGLGRMFGFRFLENFRWPYTSGSIQEFWRRWHISLSSWFRDYLYIPLGGNRKGNVRTYVNLFIVFFATGLWHGASWNFVVWGLFHGLFLVVERLGFQKLLRKLPKVVGQLYVLLVVVVGWVFFRAQDLPTALTYLGSMLGQGGTHEDVLFYLDNYFLFITVLAFLFSTPLRRYIRYYWVGIRRKMGASSFLLTTNVYEAYRILFTLLLLLWSISELAQNSYNPFIYFRF